MLKCYTMKTGEGMEVQLHAFIISKLEGAKVVSFTLYSIWPPAKQPLTPLTMKMGNMQIQPGRYCDEKNPSPCKDLKTPVNHPNTQSLYWPGYNTSPCCQRLYVSEIIVKIYKLWVFFSWFQLCIITRPRLRVGSSGQLPRASTYKGHKNVTGIIANMVLVFSGFHMEKNLTEN